MDDSWAYLAARGLALDKKRGVRPLGIPHSEFRVEANALLLVAGEDVELLLGAENLLCGGLRAVVWKGVLMLCGNNTRKIQRWRRCS